MIRREDCACGATIIGSTDDWDLNARAVRRHNDSARHATDPTVAALRARAHRAERALLRAQVQLVRLSRSATMEESGSGQRLSAPGSRNLPGAARH